MTEHLLPLGKRKWAKISRRDALAGALVGLAFANPFIGQEAMAFWHGQANSDVWAVWDGSPNAPVNGSGPQFPSLLNSYGANAPPWWAAGYKYPVGVNTNVSLLDPSNPANLPSGATANSGTKTVTISGANVTMNGFLFPVDWVVLITATSGTTTLWNCKFSGSAAATTNFIKQTGAGSSTDIRYCEFNGGQVTTLSNPAGASAIDITPTSFGSSIIRYCYFYGIPIDAINFGGPTTGTSIDIRYNLFYGLGYCNPGGVTAHPDAFQQFELTCSNAIYAFNTNYNPSGACPFAANEAINVQADTAGTLSGFVVSNNTIAGVAPGTGGTQGFSGGFGCFNEGGTGPQNSVWHSNYCDPNCTSFTVVWANPFSGSNNYFVGNIDMSTGLGTSPTAIGGVVIIGTDIQSLTPSPSSGNITTGNAVTISVLLDQTYIVSGSPTLTMNTGNAATYVSGGGSNTLVFSYTVQSGDSEAALAVTAYNLNGGKLTDTNGNAANTSTVATTFTGLSANQAVTGSFPGQAGNLVGYLNCPAGQPSHWTAGTWPGAYPGSLAAGSRTLTSGTPSAPTIISFKDYQLGTTPLSITGHDITFVGCNFAFNTPTGSSAAVGITLGSGAYNIQFVYCTGQPLTSFGALNSPPGYSWPSAGAGANTVTQVQGTNAIASTSGYQFLIGAYSTSTSGSFMLQMAYCDFWGFGNGVIDTQTTNGQINIYECHAHDPCYGAGLGYHQDGIVGYYDGSSGPNNILCYHCTVAGIANTNAIGFQGSSTGYNNVTVQNCYLSGFNATVSLGTSGSGLTNFSFVGNTFGTDLQWVARPLYINYTTIFSAAGNTWSGNTINVVAGTTRNSGSTPAWTSGNNGQFLWPDFTLHTTDF